MFPGNRRRRSSLAQLTDIIREWSGNSVKKFQKPQLNRRETLADLARSLPWRSGTIETSQISQSIKKRRESSIDVGLRNTINQREHIENDCEKEELLSNIDLNIAIVSTLTMNNYLLLTMITSKKIKYLCNFLFGYI